MNQLARFPRLKCVPALDLKEENYIVSEFGNEVFDEYDLLLSPESVWKNIIKSISRETKNLIRSLGSRLFFTAKAFIQYMDRGFRIHHRARIGLNKHFSETGYYIGFFN